MRSALYTIALLAATANAHFQLQFPPPRGSFNENNEPNFCDGYLTPSTNRTEFPLSGGFFTLNSEHPSWTAGVQVSTNANPQSFDNFQLVNSFFKVNGEGQFCIPLDFKKSNATSLTAGQNVTIQIVYTGGDGQLYQCADLTLADNFNISSSVACTNATGSASTAPSGTSPTSTAPGSTATPTTKTSSAIVKGVEPIIAAFALMFFGLAIM
ncbi:hypothetical protein D9619_003325 [Psilocybe cf. subviscida]|uniref:Copper acquisition factor BIM1-like domain-containing protein n=1 Tax=Psilocybe cf. subviscida TaxID=2480587 RepID=A0A8H5AW69_9AGAR|nr:hypothetical protein D9619_003325 [Psilocybe cf. subviscida]